MKNVFITGATGNIGMALLKALTRIEHRLSISAGVRDIVKDKDKVHQFSARPVLFDFNDPVTYKDALENMEIIFLLRPPQISDVAKYFEPLIDTIKKSSIKHIVFLSVQGVEKSKLIPHHKIEKLILESQIPFTFLRPAYFMQNFTGNLHYDLLEDNRIFLPAGSAKFTLVDVSDIGEVATVILNDIENHKNKSYELTNNEQLSFEEMAAKLSIGLNRTITYISPNLFNFYLTKQRQKMPTALILVMIMLHYLPRFQKEPKTTACIENILKRKPTTFDAFVAENKAALS